MLEGIVLHSSLVGYSQPKLVCRGFNRSTLLEDVLVFILWFQFIDGALKDIQTNRIIKIRGVVKAYTSLFLADMHGGMEESPGSATGGAGAVGSTLLF
jgi:hypothetical protein